MIMIKISSNRRRVTLAGGVEDAASGAVTMLCPALNALAFRVTIAVKSTRVTKREKTCTEERVKPGDPA